MPPESGSTRASRRSASWTNSSSSSRASTDLVAWEAEVAAVDEEVLADVELEVEVVLLRDDAEPLRGSRDRRARGRGRGRAASPPLAGETAPIIRIVELLPAPFGPRKPNVSPRVDREVDPVDRDEVAEALRQPVRLDQRSVVHAATLANTGTTKNAEPRDSEELRGSTGTILPRRRPPVKREALAVGSRRQRSASSGSSTRMRVPAPGGLSSTNVPSSASTRSRRPPRPDPSLGFAPPQPSSATSTTRTSSRGATRIVADVALAYLSTLVSASTTTKYAALSTRGVQRSASSTVTTVTEIGALPASARTAAPEPLQGQDLRMEPAGELAELLVGPGQLDQRPVEVLLRLVRVGAQLADREVDGMRDADEVLLRPVVEVPLEPLPLGVARRDDARARAPDLLLDLLPGGDVEPAQEVAEPALGVVHDRRRPVDDEPLARSAPTCSYSTTPGGSPSRRRVEVLARRGRRPPLR